MLSSSSDTRETLRHLFMFTNTAQRELISTCRQRIRNSNQLPLHYYLTLASVELQTVYFPNYIYLQGPYRKYIVSKDYKRIRNCYFFISFNNRFNIKIMHVLIIWRARPEDILVSLSRVIFVHNTQTQALSLQLVS